MRVSSLLVSPCNPSQLVSEKKMFNASAWSHIKLVIILYVDTMKNLSI